MKTAEAGHHEKVCPHCGYTFRRNPGRHVEQCGRAVREIFGTEGLSPADWRLIERAAAHVAHEALLEPQQRLRGGVSELDLARLIKGLEGGAQVYQGGRFTWTSTVKRLVRADRLALTVVEGIRTGLLICCSEEVRPSVRRIWVEPAPVHLAGWDNLRPRCDQRGDRGARRWRLVRNRSYVDCGLCLYLAE